MTDKVLPQQIQAATDGFDLRRHRIDGWFRGIKIALQLGGALTRDAQFLFQAGSSRGRSPNGVS
jgi:hypothetical protein